MARRRPHLIRAAHALREKPSPKDVVRIMSRVQLEPKTGCWIWQGYCDDAGYGQVSYKGKARWVYRVTFVMFRSKIAEGMTVDHLKCRNPSCCNPWHMSLKTLGENSADANRRRKKKKKSTTDSVPF